MVEQRSRHKAKPSENLARQLNDALTEKLQLAKKTLLGISALEYDYVNPYDYAHPLPNSRPLPQASRNHPISSTLR